MEKILSRPKNWFVFFKDHKKLILEIAGGLLFVSLGIYFIRQQGDEMGKISIAIKQANHFWLWIGLFFAVLFVVVQGMMYQFSFKAIHEKISLITGMTLFLKRNVVSVFLPAGVLTNVLFFNKGIEQKEGINRTQIYFASSIFSLCSIASTIIVGVPALFLLFLKNSLSGKMIVGLLFSILLMLVFAYIVYSIIKEGKIYHWMEKHLPSFFQVIQQLKNQTFNTKSFWLVIALSCVIEIIGIVHLYISIEALGETATWEIAVVGYAIVILLLMSSPFLRGIGAIEVALTYALTLYGFAIVSAISIAFLFRFFEFWLILIFGIIALLAQKDNVIVRLLPSILLLILGIVNIISATLPALPERLITLREVLPLDAIHASNWLVLVSGILLMVLSIYLLKGLRNAWWMALILSGLSLIAHLTKGIDWEESIVALLAISSLLYQRKQYFVRSDWKSAKLTLFPALIAVLTVLVFGTLGFYFLDVKDFGIDFTLLQSTENSIKSFFLLDGDFQPITRFGHQFLYSMNILGGLSICFLGYSFLRPLITGTVESSAEEKTRAKSLVEKYGQSALDYFKTYYDKSYFFPENIESFISYKSTSNYAIALESPVCDSPETLKMTVKKFDQYARKIGKRAAYYRIPEQQKELYLALNKKILPIGEDAIVNLMTFNLIGKSKSGLRNVVNRMTKEGYVFKTYEAPQTDAFLQQLQAVSDDWLGETGRSELIFSQGIYDENELRQQRIFTLESATGRVVAFINQIPDYTPKQANFDLMRKTDDAPYGSMDFLFIKMFECLKEKGFEKCNIGMVPMSGIEEPQTMQERAIKLAYEKMKQFSHYKSLREFKEKFDPNWTMMYLVYDAPIDIVYLPLALDKIVRT